MPTTATRSRPARTNEQKAPKPRLAGAPLSIGDRIVYPHHGAAIVTGSEQRDLDGDVVDYYVIETVASSLTLRVPAARATDLGIRPVISKTAARRVFAVLRDEPRPADPTWSRWFRGLEERMASGDVHEVATVVRDLSHAQQAKPLGPALKRMLAKARLVLTSELQLTLEIDPDEAAERLDKALAAGLP